MMKVTLTNKKSRGFSLVEVLVTTLILGVGLLGAAKFQVDVVKSSTLSQQQVEAVNIAKAQMDELLHFSTVEQYKAILSGDSTPADVANDGFTTTWAITKSNNDRGADVTLKVSWTGDQSIYLSTIVSNTVPMALALTPVSPTNDPDNDQPTFPDFPVADLADLENSDSICTCQGTTVVSSGPDADRCDLCCAEADAEETIETALLEIETRYAHLDDNFMQKARYKGDMVVSNNGFNPNFLTKGYKNVNFDKDIEKYLHKTMGGGGGGGGCMMDCTSEDPPPEEETPPAEETPPEEPTITAVCGITYITPAPTPEEEVANIVPDPIPDTSPGKTKCFYRSNRG